MKKYLLHFLFIAIVVGDLTGEFLQKPQLDHFFKPLLLIWIGSYFLLHSRKMDKYVILLASFAFLFSWIGDLFMMFAGRFMFFVSGIGSFLVAQ